MAGPYYGVNATLAATPNLGDRIIRGNEWAGDLATFTDEYTLLGTEAATEEIYLHKNKPNMRLIHALSSITLENPGTALVVDIGDDDDVDKYSDGLVLSAGGTVLLTTTPGVTLQDPVYTDPTGDQGEWVKMLIMTATSLTAGQKLRYNLVYAVVS